MTLDHVFDLSDLLDKEENVDYLLLVICRSKDGKNYIANNWWSYEDEKSRKILCRSLTAIQKSILKEGGADLG